MIQDRLAARITDSDVRYVYIVGQTGAGKLLLLAHVAQIYGPASMSLLNDWDALSPVQAEQYRLLLSHPKEGRLIVATATDPAAPNPFADKDPMGVAVFTDADLAFTLPEMTEILGHSCSPSFPRFAYEQTAGHTGTITFMQRVLRSEGEEVARDLSSSAYAPMRRFLYDRVLRTLPAQELTALLTAAAIEDFREESLRQALPACNVRSLLNNLVKRRIIRENGGAVDVFPMFRAAMQDLCREDLRSNAASAIDAFLACGNYACAARIAVQLGRPLDALTYLVLESGDVLRPDVDLKAALRALPEALLTMNARTWAGSWSFRRLTVDAPIMIGEAQSLLACYEGSEDAATVRVLRGLLGFMLGELGRFEEADAQFEMATNEPDATVRALWAASLSLRGDLARATDLLKGVGGSISATPALVSLMNDINKRRARFDGNWEAEKTFLLRAVEFTPTDHYVYEAAALHELGSGAALAGDATTFEYACERLKALEARIGMPVERFVAPVLRASRVWMQALRAQSADEAQTRLASALQELDNSGWTFGRTIVRVAVAEFDPNRRDDLLREASELSVNLGPRVADALERLRAGELPADGHLRAAALHFRKLAAPSDAPQSLSLCITKGTLERGGVPLNVSRRVFDLLVALAVRARPVTREELCAMLWPDEACDDVANALKMTIRRARLQSGEPEIICTSNGRYSLGANVACDLRVMRNLCEAALRDPAVLASNREQIFEFCVRVTSSMPHHLAEYEWFIGTHAAIESLALELSEALGIKTAA